MSARDGIFVAYASGNPAKDNTRLANAITKAKAWGNGATVFLDTSRTQGLFYYTGFHNIGEYEISLDATPNTRLRRYSSSALIQWGDDYYPWNMTTGNVDALTAGSSQINNPAIAGLAAGDWVILYSDNTPADSTPHSLSPNQPMRVCELHRINRAILENSGGTGVPVNKWYLDKPTYDAMTTNPKITKLPAKYGIRIRNIQIEMEPGQIPSGQCLALCGCIDFTLENVTLGTKKGTLNPGQVTFLFSSGRCINCWVGDHENPNRDQESLYGFVDICCNGIIREKCKFGSVRHGTTTGGRERTVSGTTYRYGGSLDGEYDNCVWGSPVKQKLNSGTGETTGIESSALCDFHSEAARYVIKNSTFYIPAFQLGFLIRSRDITFDGNTFICHTQGEPGLVYASDFTFKNNTIKGGFVIRIKNSGTQANVDRCRIMNNIWQDTYGCTIYIETGTNHEITGNKWYNCGAGQAADANQFAPKCLIYIKSLTNGSSKINISGNHAPRYSQDYFVYASGLDWTQITLDVNTGLNTYVRCSMGLARKRIKIGSIYDPSDTEPTNYTGNVGTTIAATPMLEMLYASKNGHGKYKYMNKLAHGLTETEIDKPITTMCQVFDNTLPDQEIDGWCCDIIDEDWFILYPPGTVFETPDTIIQGTYSPETMTRNLWFKTSAGKLTPDEPEDNAVDVEPIVRVNARTGGIVSLTLARFITNATGGGGNGTTTKSMGINLHDNVYYSPNTPFVNVAKLISEYSVGTMATWSTGGTVSENSNGFPTGFADPVVCNCRIDMFEGHPNGTYNFNWDGPANAVTIDGATNGASSGTFTKSTAKQNFLVRLRAGITALRVWHSSDNIASTFRTPFVTKCSRFKILRFMNWANVNFSWTPTWATRRTVNSFTQGRKTVGGVTVGEVAWDHVYQLCNAAGSAPWICVHHLANDAYVTSLAQLLHANLNPSLPVYVEHSNETWNGAFQQRQYCIDMGDGADTDPTRRGFVYHANRTAAIGNIFKANMPGRTVKTTLGVQSAGGAGFLSYAWPTVPTLTKNALNVISPAPYFGGTVGTTDSARDAIIAAAVVSTANAVNQIFTQIRSHLDDAVNGPYPQMTEMKAWCDSVSKEMIAYEGGQHLALRGSDQGSFGSTVGAYMVTANRDARMKALYTEYLNEWHNRSGGQIMCHYNDCYDPSNLYGSWGAQEFEGQSAAAAPKWDAIAGFLGFTP